MQLVMLNEAEKRKWMQQRMDKGFSFVYTKGHVPGATYEDGTPEKERNIMVECIETGDKFKFLWG